MGVQFLDSEPHHLVFEIPIILIVVNHLKGVNTYVVFWVFHSNNGTSFLWASFLAFSSASAWRSLRAR